MANTFYFRFGGKRGKRHAVKLSPNLMVVRTRDRKALADSALSRESQRALETSTPMFRIPEVGVEVWQVDAQRRSRAVRDATRLTLRKETDIQFAGRGLVSGDGEPIIYTENLFVKFDNELSKTACRRLLRAHGLEIKRPLDYARNAYFLGLPEGSGHKVFDVAGELLDLDEVELCHPELVRQLSRRGAFPQQWHLHRTRIDGQSVDAHSNVEAAWPLSRGDGVTIAIIDDGVDTNHEEFTGAGKIVAPRDTTGRDNDPTPQNGASHGTACAGVAAANGASGASGVAPHARIMPIRSVSSLGSQAEADAFVWAAEHGADVISCSWGPLDGRWWDDNDQQHDVIAPLPDSTRLAIDYAVEQGRNGKGCIIAWAAGNGNESVDNDGYASYDKVIAVAACGDRGTRSVYSDYGDAVWCSFPSSNFAWRGQPQPLTPGIWTTDVSGPLGANPGDPAQGDAAGNYTNSFGGTSSACPGAAGVAALVLARNPELNWQQVKVILRDCCDRIDTRNGRYDADGHSPWYGYGRLNAKRAVELATPQVPPKITYSTVHRTLREVEIRDRRTSKIAVQVGDRKPVLGVRVTVDIEHTWVGDLTLTLKSPGDAAVVLQDQVGGGTRNLKRTYDAAMASGLLDLVGTTAEGEWVLEVRDNATRDTGRILSFGVELDL